MLFFRHNSIHFDAFLKSVDLPFKTFVEVVFWKRLNFSFNCIYDILIKKSSSRLFFIFGTNEKSHDDRSRNYGVEQVSSMPDKAIKLLLLPSAN